MELPLEQRGGDPGDDLGVVQQVRVGLGQAGGAGREAAAEVQGQGLPIGGKIEGQFDFKLVRKKSIAACVPFSCVLLN